jgi:hypothetical protein
MGSDLARVIKIRRNFVGDHRDPEYRFRFLRKAWQSANAGRKS